MSEFQQMTALFALMLLATLGTWGVLMKRKADRLTREIDRKLGELGCDCEQRGRR